MALSGSLCSLRPGLRTPNYGSITGNRWGESMQTKSSPYPRRKAACNNVCNHIGSFCGTRLVWHGTCKLETTRKGCLHATFSALSKSASAKACMLKRGTEGPSVGGGCAQIEDGAPKLLSKTYSIASSRIVSSLVTGAVAAGLVLSASSGDVALAELSHATEQQRLELIHNVAFNATSLPEAANSSDPEPVLSTASLTAPELSPTSVSSETAASGGQGSYNEMVYGRLSELHNDEEAHRAMFTDDAWEGMNIVREYGRLIETKEEEENACAECLQNRKLVERAWQVVSNEFYDPVRGFSQAKWAQALYTSMAKAGGLLRTKAQTYAVLTDMVASLGDRYSAFLPPSLYRLAIRHPNPSEVRYLAAQYTGIGIELGPVSPLGGFTIVAPFASSPAEEAGIRPGESLVAIDGLPCEQLTRDEAATLMRGPVGSPVQLDVVSLAGQERQVTIERRTLPRPPMKHFNVSGPGGQLFSYIRLHYFSSDGTRMVQAAIKEGEALGVDGYILDLRNNPGGVFEEAVACAALWLDCGSCQVVTTVNTNAGDDVIYQADNLSKNVFPAHPGNLTRAPLVVLANRGSASASEVLAGALRDNSRAVYVGERSFGKGVIQYYFPMTDGSGLKLTVAKYLTPAKYDIAASGGLVPDLECHDYPHGRATDDCIQLAMRVMSKTSEERRTLLRPTPDSRTIPYAAAGVGGAGSYSM